MLLYQAQIGVDADKTGEFMELCFYIANQFKHEKGCRSLHLYRNKDRPHNYLLVSEWESKDSMEMHLAGEKFSYLKGGAIVLGQNFNLKFAEPGTTDYSQWEQLDLPW